MGLFFSSPSMHKCGEKFFRCFTSPSLLCLHSADTEGRVCYTSAFLCSYSLCINPTCIHVWDIVCCRTVLFDSPPWRLLCCLIAEFVKHYFKVCICCSCRFCVTSIFNVDLCVRVCIRLPPRIVVREYRLEQIMGGGGVSDGYWCVGYSTQRNITLVRQQIGSSLCTALARDPALVKPHLVGKPPAACCPLTGQLPSRWPVNKFSIFWTPGRWYFYKEVKGRLWLE